MKKKKPTFRWPWLPTPLSPLSVTMSSTHRHTSIKKGMCGFELFSGDFKCSCKCHPDTGLWHFSVYPRKIMLFLLLCTFVCVNTLYTVLLCASARALWKSSNGSAFLSFQVTLIILTAWIYPPKKFASSEVACPFQSANVESEVLNITDWPSTLILKTLYSDIHAFMWLIHNFWHSLEMHKRRCGKLYLCNTMTRCSKHNMATI